MDSCVCDRWYDPIISNLGSILLVALFGGGGATAFKFRDKLKKFFCRDKSVVKSSVEKPEVAVDIVNVENGQIEKSDSLRAIAAEYVLKKQHKRRKTIA